MRSRLGPRGEHQDISGLARPDTPAFCKIPGGDLFASWKPDLRLAFDIFDELSERRDPMGLADDVRMQAHIHDASARRALRMELIEAELEHLDAVPRRRAAACEHVEVVNVVEYGTQTIGP